MSAKKLAEHFSELEDPRCSGKVEHLLIDILVIAVCAVIAGAESWVDMALYGQNKADWLSTFLRLPNGIPAHDTFRRVFMLIDPEDFESRFTAWTQAFAVSVDREVVAIDGKTVRGSFDRSRDQGPLHIVSAWASERGLVLGQRQVGDKSNEITAVPELLDTLDLNGNIVTLDAMGCQKAFASTGPSKTACTGCSTSPSERMTVGFATAPPSAILPCCERSPLTSSDDITAQGTACADDEK